VEIDPERVTVRDCHEIGVAVILSEAKDLL
jgi:hypothetical protein